MRATFVTFYLYESDFYSGL